VYTAHTPLVIPEAATTAFTSSVMSMTWLWARLATVNVCW
jgi:hypothetical protein